MGAEELWREGLAIQAHGAGVVDGELGGEGVEERRLARARGPNDGEDLGRADVAGDAVEDAGRRGRGP